MTSVQNLVRWRAEVRGWHELSGVVCGHNVWVVINQYNFFTFSLCTYTRIRTIVLNLTRLKLNCLLCHIKIIGSISAHLHLLIRCSRQILQLNLQTLANFILVIWWWYFLVRVKWLHESSSFLFLGWSTSLFFCAALFFFLVNVKTFIIIDIYWPRIGRWIFLINIKCAISQLE